MKKITAFSCCLTLLILSACTKEDFRIARQGGIAPQFLKYCSAQDQPLLRPFSYQQIISHLQRLPNLEQLQRNGIIPKALIYINFEGELLTNPYWVNKNNPIFLDTSTLTEGQKIQITQNVQDNFASFGIFVTRNKELYDAVPKANRQKIIVTETSEPFDNPGGTAHVGSFILADDIPAMVFSNVLLWSTKYVAASITHEAGHTFSLFHHGVWRNGRLIGEYDFGDGYFAPHMGATYYSLLGGWTNDLNTRGDFQPDVQILKSTLYEKADDFSSAISWFQMRMTSDFTGILNDSLDVDLIPIRTTRNTTIKVGPLYNSVDVKLTVYDRYGIEIQQSQDPQDAPNPESTVELSRGWYYLKVQADGPYKQYMLGTYKVRFL